MPLNPKWLAKLDIDGKPNMDYMDFFDKLVRETVAREIREFAQGDSLTDEMRYALEQAAKVAEGKLSAAK